MFRRRFLSVLLPAVVFALPVLSQNPHPVPPKRALITQAINNQQLVTLRGNTRSAANASNDLGRVSEGLAMEHMQLLLQRPPELQAALDQFSSDLQDATSPSYHQWLMAAQFGEKFGMADSDIGIITNWLQSQGFVVNDLNPNKILIDFSGTAGQVRQAFRTEIHNLNVNGEAHIANMSDPQIPAAFAPAVTGIVSLHNFMPRPMLKPRTNYTFTSNGGTYEALVPGDLATIYNINPVFAQGITGKGQTIVVIEDTNVYSTTDWSTFRSKFGLSTYTSGTFTQVHPGNCTNPGVVAGNDGEAILDAEWASASAPNAAIQLASCKDTNTTFGGLIALENLLSAGNPPAIVSISYGECEAENGASANAAYNSTYQQAAAAGVSVYVSAGDEGAASCDADETHATHGIGVSGFASTPYNVAVGGTDFGDTYAGTNSTYWNSTNTSTYASAKSYIPEIPWNDSCASALLATYNGGTKPSTFCNSSTANSDGYITTASGSGGPSGCATGSPSTAGVVSGNCKGYAKPSWQIATGVPNDGVRDIPDVSLFAANGVWGHYYVFCFTDTANGGASCSGAPSTWSGAGGTSFSSPILAGVQALVNQSVGSKQGNPNPSYYKLASSNYSNVFHDVTQGDIDVVCTGTVNCYGSSTSGGRRGKTTYGVLSTSSSSDSPAYGTTSVWDFATGLGSVNVTNLVKSW